MIQISKSLNGLDTTFIKTPPSLKNFKKRIEILRSKHNFLLLLILSMIVFLLFSKQLFSSEMDENTLLSFETEEEIASLRHVTVKYEQTKDHATHGKFSLNCTFPGSEKDAWPGLVYCPKEPMDLSKSLVAVDVYNPSNKRAYFGWRFDDADGNNITCGSKFVPPRGKSTDKIVVRALSRVDSTKIKKITIYASRPREDMILYFDNLRLIEK